MFASLIHFLDPCRPGLSARQPLFAKPEHSDQLAINIESGTAYDLDDEIEELSSSVGRLKQVSSAIQEETQLTQQIMDGLVSGEGEALGMQQPGCHA